MKHERVACCHLYACMAELLGIKDLRIFVFCRHAGVSCANASLGAPTMHDHLRCLAEIVWHDSQRTHRFCWILCWMWSIEPWASRRDPSALWKCVFSVFLCVFCFPMLSFLFDSIWKLRLVFEELPWTLTTTHEHKTWHRAQASCILVCIVYICLNGYILLGMFFKHNPTRLVSISSLKAIHFFRLAVSQLLRVRSGGLLLVALLCNSFCRMPLKAISKVVFSCCCLVVYIYTHLSIYIYTYIYIYILVHLTVWHIYYICIYIYIYA